MSKDILWESVKSDGLPSIGEPVLLYSNSVIQNAIYFIDATDGEDGLDFFWDTEDSRVDEGIKVKGSDEWIYLSEIPTPK